MKRTLRTMRLVGFWFLLCVSTAFAVAMLLRQLDAPKNFWAGVNPLYMIMPGGVALMEKSLIER